MVSGGNASDERSGSRVKALVVRVAYAIPLFANFALACAAVLFYSESPSRFDPARAWEGPSWSHWLGTSEAGVDLLAILSHGELSATILAVCVSLGAFAIGVPLGASAAYRGGAYERFVSRGCDVIQAIPSFLFAVTVLAAVRVREPWLLGVVFLVTAWAPFARVALAQTRVLRSVAFVDAARSLGATRARILARHIAPHLLPIAAVQLGSSAAAIVVSESALAFLGFGPRSGVSMGAALDQGVAAMLRAPHVLIFSAIAVAVTSMTLLFGAKAFAPEKDDGR